MIEHRVRFLAFLFLWWYTAAGPVAASGDITFVLIDAGTETRVTQAQAWLLPARMPLPVRSDGTIAAPRPDLDAPGCRLQVVAEGYEVHTVPCTASSTVVTLPLTPAVLRTHERVTVTTRGADARAFDQPASTVVVARAELDRRLPRTTPEVLMQTAGVWVQKTNHGGGAPFLRGLVGNQVLVLIDGVRLNNATVRYGPNQYLATVDPGQIERIEVLRGGGGSILYGSDALGGVINVVTRRPQLSAGGVTFAARASGRIVSADMERSGRVDVSLATRRIAIAGGVATRDYGDLHAGGTLGVEAPSAYRETNGDWMLVAQLGPRTQLSTGYQHVHQFDVPRFDQVAQRGFLRYSFDPQIRQLGLATLSHRGGHAFAREVRIGASWHRSFERRERQQRGSLAAIAEEDRVTTAGLQAEAQSVVWRGWSVRYGLDLHHDVVRSSRRDLRLDTGVATARRGLYPDGARSLGIGLFAISGLETSRLDVEAGVRVTRTSLDATDLLFGTLEPVSRATVGSAAASYAVHGGLRVFGSVAQGFRAPNLDDVSTLGLFDSGIEIPAPLLKPERSVSYETGVKWRGPRTAVAAAAWRMQLADLIDRARAQLEGQDVLDGQRVFQRRNVGEAYVRGTELEIEQALSRQLTAFAWVATTFGRQTTAGQPMRRIPPTNGAIGLRWTSPRLSAELLWRAADRQARLALGDRDDHRMNPNGTPGWATVGATVAYRLHRDVRLVGGFDNLFDRAYRVHGSGIDGYGRHAWIGLHVLATGRAAASR